MMPPIRTGLTNNCRAMWTLATLFAAGCGTVPATDPPPLATEPDVTATVINVTPFEVSVLLSGIRGNDVDTVERRADTLDTAEVTFVCIDELVVGDPLAPEKAGVLIDPDGQAERIEPFSILVGESFFCGDFVEIIVSGNDADTFAVDIFAFTPP